MGAAWTHNIDTRAFYRLSVSDNIGEIDWIARRQGQLPIFRQVLLLAYSFEDLTRTSVRYA